MSDDAANSTAGGLFERNGWRLKLPQSPLVLDDARLLEYRHPAEYRVLALALIAIAILVAGALVFREKDILLAVLAIYVSMLATTLQAKTYYRLQGAEVTATQFSAIHQIFEQLRQRFNAPPTRVFILRKPGFKAEAFGLGAPYIIVLPTGLVDAINLEELRYVLGQALGQICFGHTRITCLLGGRESTLPAVLSWVASVRDLVFAGYWRAAMISEDRAGVLACEGVMKALQAQVKLSVGSNQVRELAAEDLINQAYKVSQGLARFQAMLIRWHSPEVPLIPRMEAMLAWAGVRSDRQADWKNLSGTSA